MKMRSLIILLALVAGALASPYIDIECSGGKIYSYCGSACPLTCENVHADYECEEPCVKGCFCPEGRVDNDGECVEPSECGDGDTPEDLGGGFPGEDPGDEFPDDSDDEHENYETDSDPNEEDNNDEPEECTGGKVFLKCGSACPQTCKNIASPPVICTLQCVQDCFCTDGKVDNDGVCVDPAECPQEPDQNPDTENGDNSDDTDEDSDTENEDTSDESDNESPVEGTNENADSDGEDTSDESDNESPVEGTNENADSDGEDTSDESDDEFPGDGTDEPSDSDDESPKEPTEECPEGKVFMECGSMCPETCGETEYLVCTEQCVRGCFCPEGQLVTQDGDCVYLDECDSMECRANETYSECATPCPRTCENRNLLFACAAVCTEGCVCKENYVLNKNKDCVAVEDCGCGKNEIYSDCPCDFDCEALGSSKNCLECAPGCACEEGYVRLDGYCVPEEKCVKKSGAKAKRDISSAEEESLEVDPEQEQIPETIETTSDLLPLPTPIPPMETPNPPELIPTPTPKPYVCRYPGRRRGKGHRRKPRRHRGKESRGRENEDDDDEEDCPPKFRHYLSNGLRPTPHPHHPHPHPHHSRHLLRPMETPHPHPHPHHSRHLVRPMETPHPNNHREGEGEERGGNDGQENGAGGRRTGNGRGRNGDNHGRNGNRGRRP